LSALMIETEQFSYAVHYSSRRRSVALQVKQGQLTVRAPLGYSVAEIKTLVLQKQQWVLKHLQRVKLQTKPQWLAEQQLPLLGTTLALTRQRGGKSVVLYSEDNLTVIVSSRVQPQRYQKVLLTLLQKWYHQQAFSWFTQRVLYWQNKMNVRSGNILIGSWRTKWGYCKSTSELGFNWRLMMAPDWIADYVVVHELAHLKHLNHSARFWQLVDEYYPQADDAKAWLRHNQHLLEL
jgi:predicted metal-dependent hydrolase